MTFMLPSDADPGQAPPPPAPLSSPDFLAQLTAAQQADAHGKELTDSEFIGPPSASGAAVRSGQPLSQMSDADLQAIAAQGPSGATGGWSNAPMVHRWANAPLAPVPGRNFDDVERAFPPAPDLSSV